MPAPSAPSFRSWPGDRLTRLLVYIEVDPVNPVLRRYAAEDCLALGRMDEALSHADAGLRTTPDDPHLLNVKARTLMALGRAPQAVPLLASVLRTQADSHVAFNLAYAQMQCGDPHAARAALASFVSGEPEPGLAAMWIRCLHHLGDLDTAIEFARKHEARCASNAPFRAAASLAYFDGENFEEADAASRAALAIDAGAVEALIVRGSLALGRADAAQAIADFQQALQRKPNEGRAASGLGMAQLLAGDAAGAREALRQATVLMPIHIGTWHALGWACIALKGWDEAASAMRQALELDRTFGESHGAIAVVAALSGRRDEAQAFIERALRLDGKGLSARYAQMVLNGEATDPSKFEKAARRVLSSRSLPGGLTLADIVRNRV
jgi:tetratricopeptide (TPR) repeat protein